MSPLCVLLIWMNQWREVVRHVHVPFRGKTGFVKLQAQKLKN